MVQFEKDEPNARLLRRNECDALGLGQILFDSARGKLSLRKERWLRTTTKLHRFGDEMQQRRRYKSKTRSYGNCGGGIHSNFRGC
jgi:hypothetical protein